MSKRGPADRLALVGANGNLGRELRDCLYRCGFPGAALELLDQHEQMGAGLLTEYGEEARVVLEAADEQLMGHRLLCFCAHPEAASRMAPRLVAAGGIVIDCTGVTWPGDDARLVRAADADAAISDGPGVLVVPRPATLLLADLATALGADFGDASVTLLLPASEKADAGPEELARQATGLLSLGELPDDLVDRRVAFDAFPVGDAAVDRVALEINALEVPRPHMAMLRASLLHGIAASVHLPGVLPDDAAERLGKGGILVAASDSAGRPLDSPGNIAGHAATGTARPRSDGRDGSWLWAVQDNYRAIAGIVTGLAFAGTGREPADTTAC